MHRRLPLFVVTGAVALVGAAVRLPVQADPIARLLGTWVRDSANGPVRYRDGFDQVRLMEPGKTYKVPVHLHATSWYLPPGHRLRVDVSSSDFPRFDRNLNTGGHNYDETIWRTAKTTVYHSAIHASRLILPIAP